MNDELTLLLLLDVQARGQEVLDGVAAGLEQIATQGGLALQALTPLSGAFGGLLEAAAGLGEALATDLSGIDWSGIAATAVNGLQQALVGSSGLPAVVGGLASGLQQALAEAVAAVQTGELAAALSGLLGSVVGGIDWTQAVAADATAAVGTFGAMLERAVLQPAEQALGSLSQMMQEALGGIGAQALAAIQRAAAAIATSGPGQLAAAAGDALAAIDQALANFVPEATALGGQIIDALWQGIDGLAGWMATNVSLWLEANILLPVQTIFGLSGGSSGVSAVMATIGVALVQGLMDGMASLAGALLAATNNLVAPLLPALQSFQPAFTDVGGALMESLRGGIMAKAGEIADEARAVVQAAIDAAQSVLNGIESGIGAAQSALSGAGAAVGHNAMGASDWRGGLTWVGEQGPELVNLPRGAQVLPLSKFGLPGGYPLPGVSGVEAAADGTPWGLSAPGYPPAGVAGNGVINVYVSGNTVLSDQDADLLASRVGQAIVRQTGLAYSLVR